MDNNNPFDQYDENPFQDSAVIEATDFQEEQVPEYVDDGLERETDKKVEFKGEEKEEKKGKGKGKAKGFFGAFKIGSGSSSGRERLYDEEEEEEENVSEKMSPFPPAYEDPFTTPTTTTTTTTMTPMTTYQVGDETTRRKEEELFRRERELEEKAKKLQQQEQDYQQGNPSAKVKNWPFFYPLIFHSIPTEIPEEWQKLVKHLYYSWLLTVACLFVNIISTMCILIAGVNGNDFGFAIMYFFVITPLSFVLWYRPVYNAFMKDTSFYFITYLFFCGFHILFLLYMCLGLVETGSSGVINTVFLFSKQKIGEGVICLLGCIFWFVLTGIHIFLYRKVYMIYKFRGHTFEQARNQAFASAATSDTGKQAMSTAITTIATSSTQGQNQV